MAWNPNIPTVTNRVQDDLNAILANFQHLHPLAPYVEALLDSRIVEMGSNSNGKYVRWENGLQLCYAANISELVYESVNFLSYTWTFPAAFISRPHVFVGTAKGGVEQLQSIRRKSLPGPAAVSSTSILVRVMAITGQFYTTEDREPEWYALAIGRWK